MLKKVLIVVAVLVVVFLIFVATRPATYTVERSATIAAPVDVVFPMLNSHKEFVKWSPWEKLDPKMEKTFTGPESGAGATYAWKGNDDVGSGKMTITESKPNEVVKADLEFVEPFASKSQLAWMTTSEGANTKVTWQMNGNNDFMGKLFSVFMDMDKMIGKDFEAGLETMKTQAEAKAKEAPPPPPPPTEGTAPAGDAGPAAAPAAADAGPG